MSDAAPLLSVFRRIQKDKPPKAPKTPNSPKGQGLQVGVGRCSRQRMPALASRSGATPTPAYLAFLRLFGVFGEFGVVGGSPDDLARSRGR
ncbi:MAG: hypothetical protein R3225_06695, partial [Halofilum sp. (in: g-proteobacteria)]|nr:hypothetical protein [Halofilum sp. (in: g-proteobacteria)]